MVRFSEIIYYNLLKKAGIVLVVLGIILGLIVVSYLTRWGSGVQAISNTPSKSCSSDLDCREWCGDCINKNYKDLGVCAVTEIKCRCIEGTCQQA